MNLAEYLEDLDPKLATNLERALDAVRGEFEQKLAATVKDAVSAAAADAAAPETASAEPAPSSAVVSLDAADELRLAALDIDTAKSQSEILEALTRSVLRFSSRVAIFVNRGQEVHGWSASGFGSADATIREVSLSHELPFPIGSGLGDGAVALSAEDCALVCDAIGAEPPSMGLLLPFVLGSQIVGTVYCDRLSDEPFSVSALQLLAYLAGQTLETLPVRKRDSTATLTLARGSAAGAATTATAEPGVEESATQPEPAPEPEPVTGEAGGASEPAQDDPTETLDQPEPGPLEEAAPEAWAATTPVASAPEAISVDEEGTRPGTLEATPAPEPPPVPEPAPAPEPTPEPEATPAPEPTPEPEATPAPEASAVAPPAAEPTTTAEADDDTGAAADPAVSLSSTQVAPPDDLQGPGWAFTGSGDAGDATSETEHEEAQRLARLLVTEIKLYNEEAVEQGRRDGDVYSRLQEDIDRSRQIFEDRIDPGVRSENDYFKQALVRILAGGDPSLLGI